MAYPTITGFGPSANSAYTSALVEFSGTYGGCPSGLVGIPDSGTSGSSAGTMSAPRLVYGINNFFTDLRLKVKISEHFAIDLEL